MSKSSESFGEEGSESSLNPEDIERIEKIIEEIKVSMNPDDYRLADVGALLQELKDRGFEESDLEVIVDRLAKELGMEY